MASSKWLSFVIVQLVLGFVNAVDVTVDLDYSTYIGTAQSGGTGVTEWLGIRYAAAPVGDLRFMRPQDPVVETTPQVASEVCMHILFYFGEY